ncbi:MAG: type 4a pilus biogenesis protein PilO [Candidatus Nealsonbacteria bacterium]
MNKIIIIIAGVIIASVVAVVLAWPQYQKIQGLNADIKNKQAELQSRESYFSQIRETSAKLQEYPDALSKISSALPDDPSLASLALVKFLQVNTAQTGLILKKIASGSTIASSAKQSLAETQIIIQVAGSYAAFKNFLALIENSARLIEVPKISIGIPEEASQESPTFTLDLKAMSY